MGLAPLPGPLAGVEASTLPSGPAPCLRGRACRLAVHLVGADRGGGASGLRSPQGHPCWSARQGRVWERVPSGAARRAFAVAHRPRRARVTPAVLCPVCRCCPTRSRCGAVRSWPPRPRPARRSCEGMPRHAVAIANRRARRASGLPDVPPAFLDLTRRRHAVRRLPAPHRIPKAPGRRGAPLARKRPFDAAPPKISL